LRPLGLGFGGKKAGQSNIGQRWKSYRPIKTMLTSTLISHNPIKYAKRKISMENFILGTKGDDLGDKGIK